ncbi:ring finger protein [Gregarina niphandrodes]|uniref:RING-type E3 ubiquitin transferase n=1 Tax=Gregarina niphandrodes TaxID=110365 RepID=A0A023B6P0_GRENI|nr:ring finger protein [Gregarina niphandrodes]EZG66668.1 ring finger protein [Gregarina niphandrodes]|eukprot:XP_011130539.1 ring finger protein [Gregarina niphandrodes]
MPHPTEDNNIGDSDAATLSDFERQLTGHSCGVCVSTQNRIFRAYVAVKSNTLHKPREETIRDYRLGPRIEGKIREIAIALLPGEEGDSSEAGKSPSESPAWKTAPASWVKSIKEVLTFGKSLADSKGADEIRGRSQSEEQEEMLVALANALKERFAKRKCVLIYGGMHVKVAGQRLLITSAIGEDQELAFCGLGTGDTVVTPALDDPGEFSKIHVCPFMDTIPQAYEMDIFQDALSPFFAKHPLVLLAEGDTFQYNSVEFKVVSSKPASVPVRISLEKALSLPIEELIQSIPVNKRKHRVGPSTAVCLGFPILPHWIDILSPARQHIVMSLPAPIQSLMLINFVSETGPSEIERVMNATEAMGRPQLTPAARVKEMADSVSKLRVDVSKTMEEDGVCIICLGNLEKNDEIVKLSCSHVFHSKCLLHWLVRTKTCPLCKVELTDIDLPKT